MRNKGHRSKTHQQHTKNEVHDFEESLRLEEELRDETNDEVLKNKNQKKKPMTRAERRKKRREDRERRRKERAARREKAGNTKTSRPGPMSIIFWSTMNFFWSMLRPWTWPLLLSIPLLLICFIGIGYGAYSV